MGHTKLDAANELIHAVRGVRAALSTAQHARTAPQQMETMHAVLQAQRDVVRAAHAVTDAPTDPESDKVIGKVLLTRIEQAVAARSRDDWDALGVAALDTVQEGMKAMPPEMEAWMVAVKPLEALAAEADARADQQGLDAMLEGFRRGAAATPGMNLHIEEVVNDHVVRDETVLGPEPGETDGPGFGTSYLPNPKAAVLGIDDDRLDMEIERFNRLHGSAVLSRHGLPMNAQPEQVRSAVANRLYRQMDRDFSVSIELTGDLPSPIRALTTSHFPALRAQLLRQHHLVMAEGSTLSRAKRGDRSADAMVTQFVILGDVLAAAEPYYLPVAQIQSAVAVEEKRSLPSASSFLVWHDDLLPVGGGVRVLAWVFMTDEEGRLYDLAHCITVLGDEVWEASWCNLREGAASTIARSVAATLQSGAWRQAKRLHLGAKVDSAPWKTALIRSGARVRSGGLHGLWTHPNTGARNQGQ